MAEQKKSKKFGRNAKKAEAYFIRKGSDYDVKSGKRIGKKRTRRERKGPITHRRVTAADNQNWQQYKFRQNGLMARFLSRLEDCNSGQREYMLKYLLAHKAPRCDGFRREFILAAHNLFVELDKREIQERIAANDEIIGSMMSNARMG